MIKKNFQTVYDFNARCQFVKKCTSDSPDYVPVFVYAPVSYSQRVKLRTNKYVVKRDMQMGKFLYFLRDSSNVSMASGLLIFTDQGELPTLTLTVGEVYERYKDTDGFLYLQVVTESMFGA